MQSAVERDTTTLVQELLGEASTDLALSRIAESGIEDVMGQDLSDDDGDAVEPPVEQDSGASEEVPQSAQKKRCMRREIDFAGHAYRRWSGTLQGDVRSWAVKVGDDFGVLDMQLWLSYIAFLLILLLLQRGRNELPATPKAWLLRGLPDPVLPRNELVYFEKAIPSLDARLRSRGPWLERFFQSLCGLVNITATGKPILDLAVDARQRVFHVYFFIGAVLVYVGNCEFLDNVLLPDQDDGHGPLSHFFRRYVLCEDAGQGLLARVRHILRLYALTRKTSKRWFCRTDGSRPAWPSAAECPRVAYDSRWLDALLHAVHVPGGWWDRSLLASRTFLDILSAVLSSSSTSADVSTAVIVYMRALLSFPLIGRPSAAVNPTVCFCDAVHCYWAKFLFSHSLLVLEDLSPDSQDRVDFICTTFTFVGPAPCILLAELWNSHGDKEYQRHSLAFIGQLAALVNDRLGTRHTAYAIQITACDFHRAAQILDRASAGEEVLSFRAGRATSARAWLETFAKDEEQLIRIRSALALRFCRAVSERWGSLTADQKAWVLREFDASKPDDVDVCRKARDALRLYAKREFSWHR